LVLALTSGQIAAQLGGQHAAPAVELEARAGAGCRMLRIAAGGSPEVTMIAEGHPFKRIADRTSNSVSVHNRQEAVQSSLTWFRGSEEEADLIVAARNGDTDAFAVLFRQYRPRVFILARKYFAPGSDRDDLLQEATIGFFKAIRDFRGDRGTFGAFAELCVRRQVITFVKTATRQKHAALNSAISLDAPIFSESDEPLIGRLAAKEDVIAEIDTDSYDFLSLLLQRCSGLERGVLSMYSRGYKFEEMAYELRVHWKSIDNAVWRVKVKAKKLLAEKPLKSQATSTN
jgi:RNA polymerase sporulation-specific sigma factor